MIQRNGDVVIRMLANVQQETIKPYIEATIMPGTLVYTDEYNIYCRLPEWGYEHKTVNHGAGEYARDEDGDGFHEVHGLDHTEVFLRRNYQFTLAFLSLYTT